MLRSICTRWLGPTNHNGSRVKAIGRKRESDMPALTLTDSWDYGHSVEENHARVAKLLAAKLGWSGLYVGGSTDDGFAFVNMGGDIIPSSFAGHTLARHPLGIENRDWFYLAQVAR